MRAVAAMDPMIATGGVRAKRGHSGPSTSRLPSAREEARPEGSSVINWELFGVLLASN